MSRLNDRVFLVSGGARGLGAAQARAIVREGGKVVIGDVLDAEGRKLAAELGAAAVFVRQDVTAEADWAAAVDAAQALGGLHGLINNAGIYVPSTLMETDAALFERHMRINQLGCFLGMRACVEPMRAAGGGSIINIASTAGIEGVAGALPYTASKHAVVGMTRAAALELAALKIRVNVVCPGGMATPLLVESLGVPLETLTTMDTPWNPLRRMGHPDEIARAALFWPQKIPRTRPARCS